MYSECCVMYSECAPARLWCELPELLSVSSGECTCTGQRERDPASGMKETWGQILPLNITYCGIGWGVKLIYRC